jgi:hypothetical protein
MQIMEDSDRLVEGEANESSRLMSEEGTFVLTPECFINQVDSINEEAIVLIENNDY